MMPFYVKDTVYPQKIKYRNYNRKQIQQNTLRATPKPLNINKNSLTFLYKIREKYLFFHRRASLSAASLRKCSMTLEACLVLPLFMAALMSLINLLDGIRLYANMTAAIQQTGNYLSVAAYAAKDNSFLSIGFNTASAAQQVKKYLRNIDSDTMLIKDGLRGINYSYSKFLEQDIIDIIAVYELLPGGSAIKVFSIPLYNRFYGHAWNGYDLDQTFEGAENEIYVYITQTGAVYHRTRGCTYLKLSIEAVSEDALGSRRNENGAKYYACELCGNGSGGGLLYITAQGTRYHTFLNCSGLKRTIYSIPLTQVGNRRPCSKCG